MPNGDAANVSAPLVLFGLWCESEQRWYSSSRYPTLFANPAHAETVRMLPQNCKRSKPIYRVVKMVPDPSQ
jgi:hypothetical protein